MFGADFFIWLLLPLGVALGWVLSRQIRGATPSPPRTAARDDRIEASGTNAAGDEPWAVLGRVADGASGAARAQPQELHELQLMLGASLRQRGEIERAIALHESLATAAAGSAVDDPAAAERANAAQLELARDYLKAGLMDRAETLLDGLVARGAMVAPALELSLAVHEQAHDWKRAAATAERLQSTQARDLRPLLAHYRCEVAEQCIAAGDAQAADQHLRRALDISPDSVRASLLLGDLAEKRNDPVAALHAWQRVPRQDARFLAEVLPRLARASEAAGQSRQFAEFMNEADRDFPEAISVTLEQARLIGERGGDVAGYLAGRLSRRLHWTGLLAWLDAQCTQHPDAHDLASLRDALRKRLQGEAAYRCNSCGLTPGMLFWQCPSCKQWGTVVPDDDHR